MVLQTAITKVDTAFAASRSTPFARNDRRENAAKRTRFNLRDGEYGNVIQNDLIADHEFTGSFASRNSHFLSLCFYSSMIALGCQA